MCEGYWFCEDSSSANARDREDSRRCFLCVFRFLRVLMSLRVSRDVCIKQLSPSPLHQAQLCKSVIMYNICLVGREKCMYGGGPTTVRGGDVPRSLFSRFVSVLQSVCVVGVLWWGKSQERGEEERRMIQCRTTVFGYPHELTEFTSRSSFSRSSCPITTHIICPITTHIV